MTYEGDSPHHYFMVRVDGKLRIQAQQGASTKMIVDTLFSTPESTVAIEAADAGDGDIEIEFRPFDIEGYKGEGAPAWGQQRQELLQRRRRGHRHGRRHAQGGLSRQTR